jgi:hypothetical protein
MLNDNDSEEDEDSGSDVDKDLINFFKSDKKSKKKAAKTNVPKESVSTNISPKKQKATIDFPFKMFIEPLNPKALNRYDKPEYWEAHTENSAFETLDSLAVDYSLEKLNATNATEIDFNKGSKIVLECTAHETIVLYPQLRTKDKADRKPAEGMTKPDSVWFYDFQMWKFNKSGFIYNQFFPKLCLTLNTTIAVKLEIRLRPQMDQQTKGNRLANRRMSDGSYQDKTEVIIKTGYAVVLGTRQLNESNNYRDKDQQWHFNKVI